MQDRWREIQKGCKVAFKELFYAHYECLIVYAFRISNDRELSKDIVNDCFLRLWNNRNNIEIKSSIQSYLMSMVRNDIFQHLRRNPKTIDTSQEILDRIEDTPTYNMEKERQIIQLHNIIQQLPEQRRKILELAVFEEMTYKEIAAHLKISTNTVKTQIGRAYRYLKENLPANNSLIMLLLQKKINLA
ncbi:RNA polymerase sigma-70 factor [Prolixibacteraceae bacterium JC049]|nr:RNA polymerase sigma-70 factor [Prolixibacteraceae bacterium JC049]